MEASQLVRASRKGDRESFGQIVSAHQGRVCSVAYGITGSVEQSEDLAQEAFVAAWRALADLRELERFPAWVCGIARNLARKALRRRERDTLWRLHPLPWEEWPSATTPMEAALWESTPTLPSPRIPQP